MALEDEIKKLTAAVLELSEKLAGDDRPAFLKSTGKGATAADTEIAEPVKPKAAAKPAAAKAETAKPATAKADDGIDPAYAPVKAAILDAIAKNFRPQISALFKKHGVKNGQELDPSAYDEVLGEIDAIVNGEGDLA